ncbi:MAG: RimK family alpha-L-glutamate ligase [Clostridia bacterium]|nr:RimK family alpha-L-glutamate ligase [Clostridia bacterium]
MNKEYAVLYNRSLESVFGDQARQVATELDCPCLYTDELLLLDDDQIDFRKCVYFDKDVIAGLRLEMLGVRLYNNIGSIELCDDKRRTAELLRHDLSLPKTIPSPLLFSDDPSFWEDYTSHVGETLGFPLIGKLAFGSLGQQVRLIYTLEQLRDCCREWNDQPHLFQEYIEASRGKDVRIYVVGGRAIAAMERHNPNDFRSNIGAGGNGKKIVSPAGFEEAAVEACSLLGLDFGGVDLLYGSEGEPLICEVNSNALFRELNSVCNVHIEQHIADLVRAEYNESLDLTKFF